MPKSGKKKKTKKPEGWWVPPAGEGDYTEARRKHWNPTFEELAARLKERSKELKRQRRKAS
jgi:hypothetical protein